MALSPDVILSVLELSVWVVGLLVRDHCNFGIVLCANVFDFYNSHYKVAVLRKPKLLWFRLII